MTVESLFFRLTTAKVGTDRGQYNTLNVKNPSPNKLSIAIRRNINEKEFINITQIFLHNQCLVFQIIVFCKESQSNKTVRISFSMGCLCPQNVRVLQRYNWFRTILYKTVLKNCRFIKQLACLLKTRYYQRVFFC